MQVTIETKIAYGSDYFREAAEQIRTGQRVDRPDGTPRHNAARVLERFAAALEAQEPIKPGVYRVGVSRDHVAFADFQGGRWFTAAGGQIFVGYDSRSDFEVLEFIGTREGQDD